MIDIVKRTFIQNGYTDPYVEWCTEQGIHVTVKNTMLSTVDRISNIRMILTPEQATMFKLKFG